MRTHVARDRRRGLQVRTVGSLRNPIFERRGIDVGTEQERLFAFTELVDLGVGALVDANDLAFFIDPDRRWDIHEIEHATDDVVFINNLHVGRLGRIEDWSRHGFAAGVLSCADDDEIRIIEFFVDCLPHGQVELAASPGRPGDYQRLFALEIGQSDHFALAVLELEFRRHGIQ